MCGIVGFYTPKPRLKPNREYFTQALYVDALRGHHGTGVAAVHEKGNVIIHKKAIHAFDYMDTRTADDLFSYTGFYNCMIGHNRFKTHGMQSNRNTHPFQHGNITLVHNGSVATHNLPGTQEVDSEQICHALSQDTIENVVAKLDGAFALVWWDSDEKAMYAIRNEERPLWFAKDSKHDTVFFASERGMLVWIAARNGIELDAAYQPQPGELLRFSGDTAVPEVRTLPLFQKPPVGGKNTTGGIKHNNWGNVYNFPDILNKHGLRVGDTVIVHPVTWETTAKGKPNDSTYGFLYLLNTESKAVFRHAACKFKEYDATLSYKARVCGSAWINDKEFVSVAQMEPVGENEFELDNDTVYLQQVNTKERNSTRSKNPKKKSAANDAAGDDEVALMLPGPDNHLVTDAEYIRLIRHGCSYCGDPLDIDDAPSHVFDTHGNVYCDSCAKIPMVRQFLIGGK